MRLMEGATYKRLRDDFHVFYAELKKIHAVSGLGIIKPGQTSGQALTALYNMIEDEIMAAVDKFSLARLMSGLSMTVSLRWRKFVAGIWKPLSKTKQDMSST